MYLLKYYGMSVHYLLWKANVVDNALSRLSMGSTTHVDDEKKDLVKDVHRLVRLGVGLLTLLVGVFHFILVMNHPW